MRKANQYFVRGFNLDHGTDFQTGLEGMPLNMPSHAHGQGYTDLNFLIPELVDRIDYRLGVYHTELGDFGSAGGADFRLVRALDRAVRDARRRRARPGANRVRRATLGIRGDAYTFDVTSDRPSNSGRRAAAIASPKASVAFVTSPKTEFYVSGGLGFHSNDARGTTISVDPATGDPAQRVDPLVRSRGAEVGFRASPVRGLRSTLALWALELDSELLFTGDGGATEPSDRSRRGGLTLASFYRPVSGLSFDADVSLAHARFAGVRPGAEHVPGALENVVAAGVAWTSVADGPFAALRLRRFGSYPLIEDNSVRATATTLLNADVGYSLRGMRLQATVLNVLGARANDIQYYSSRLPGEAAAGMDDVHFHPVEPRQIRVSLSALTSRRVE